MVVPVVRSRSHRHIQLAAKRPIGLFRIAYQLLERDHLHAVVSANDHSMLSKIRVKSAPDAMVLKLPHSPKIAAS
jgi:hypothetical protein